MLRPCYQVMLDAVAEDVSQILEKIETRERFVNSQLEPLAQEFQVRGWLAARGPR